jgi:aspartyl aminopeptidase
MDENAVKNAKQFLGFLNKSPTPYHVVDNVRNLLRSDLEIEKLHSSEFP